MRYLSAMFFHIEISCSNWGLGLALYEIVIAISNYLLSECLREIFQTTFKIKQFGVGENATTASLDTRI